jgi:uncharacterized protein YkwD
MGIFDIFRRKPRPQPQPQPSGSVPPTSLPIDPLAAAILDEINRARAMHGRGPVSHESRLAAAAQGQAEDVARHEGKILFGPHRGSDGSKEEGRVSRQGYQWSAVGEIEAPALPSQAIDPQDVVQRWLNDRPHRVIMLDPRYREAGVGVARSHSGTGHAVVDFAAPAL